MTTKINLELTFPEARIISENFLRLAKDAAQSIRYYQDRIDKATEELEGENVTWELNNMADSQNMLDDYNKIVIMFGYDAVVVPPRRG